MYDARATFDTYAAPTSIQCALAEATCTLLLGASSIWRKCLLFVHVLLCIVRVLRPDRYSLTRIVWRSWFQTDLLHKLANQHMTLPNQRLQPN